jgi:hypothetical protein
MKLLGSGLVLPHFLQDKFDETAQKLRKLDGIKFHLNPSSAVKYVLMHRPAPRVRSPDSKKESFIRSSTCICAASLSHANHRQIAPCSRQKKPGRSPGPDGPDGSQVGLS